MGLMEYFGKTRGLGVLSTADNEGKVDSAVYAKPKVVDEENIAFIMSDRLSRSNVRKNQFAVYLFKEEGESWDGKRLYLKYDGEVEDEQEVARVCEQEYPGPYCGEKYLKGSSVVRFKVVSVLPLVGDGTGKKQYE